MASRVQASSTNSSLPTCREPPFTASDVVELYLHRGAFEPALSDEDAEQDPDRWCSHSAWGQECWQVASQWVWNLRLALGHQLHPDAVRTTEFAPAVAEIKEQQPPAAGYGKPAVAAAFKAGRFSGQDFALQSDGTLRCPADQKLIPQEHRREADGSLRVVYGASIRSCRPWPDATSSVNGVAALRRSLARRVSSCIRSKWVPHRCSGEIGAAENTDADVSSWCVINTAR